MQKSALTLVKYLKIEIKINLPILFSNNITQIHSLMINKDIMIIVRCMTNKVN